MRFLKSYDSRILTSTVAYALIFWQYMQYMQYANPQLILQVRFLNSLNLKKILGFFLLFLGHMNFVDNVGEDEQILSQRTFQTKSRKQILHKNANIYFL